MWRGSAMEYEHEKQNERVCLECGAKRKDHCTGDGKWHESRRQLMATEREFERLQDLASDYGLKADRLRHEIRTKWESEQPGEAHKDRT